MYHNPVGGASSYRKYSKYQQVNDYCFVMIFTTAEINRLHKTLGVLHIVKLASWLRFAEGALQLKPTCLLMKLHC